MKINVFSTLSVYQVKPVIKMLKSTLVGTGILLATAVSLLIFATPVEDFFQSFSNPKANASVAPVVKTLDFK